jgi:uroporphyrinogen decarboxylase
MTEACSKPMLQALRGKSVSPAPVWLMRQAGRYLPEYRELRAKAGGFLDLCLTPEYAAEVTLQPIRRFGFDGAILFSDILVVPWALGRALRFEEGQGPVLEPLQSEDLRKLRQEGLTDRVAPVLEALDRVKTALPETTTMIGFAGAPWTVASYMIEGGASKEFLKVKSWALGRPEEFQTLIGILIDATVAYLSAQVAAGAEVLQIFDSWMGSLSETEAERWSLAPLSRIVEELKVRHPQVPIILFPRGAGLGYTHFAETSGADGLSLDTTVPLSFAKTLQKAVTVQGNLDPAALVVGGKALESGVERIMATLGQGPFIFNLGHGILPDTPPEHVQRLVNHLRREAS